MTKLARTVHLTDPESGESKMFEGGTDVSPEDEAAIREVANNPSIWEGDENVDLTYKGLDAYSEGEFYFAADANAALTPEETEERLEANADAAAPQETDDDYSTWKVPRLREEIRTRQESGEDITPDGTQKADLVSALKDADARKG